MNEYSLPSATFQSQNSIKDSPPNTFCVWKLAPEPRPTSIQLRFDELNMGSFDTLFVLDGADLETATMIGQFTGFTPPPPIVSHVRK